MEQAVQSKRLPKAERKAVWDKSGGVCWYCGEALPERGWHADHAEPVLRIPGRMIRAHNDTVENTVPACRSCNLFKGGMGVETFREQLEAQVERARRSSVNFRMAERFGLVSVAEPRVVFWFERQRPMEAAE